MLTKNIKDIMNISDEDIVSLTSILEIALKEVVLSIEDIFGLKPLILVKKVKIGEVKDYYGLNFGTQRIDNEIIFGDWLFSLPKIEKESLLYFLVVKEGLTQFIKLPDDYLDICEVILNIVTVLFLKESLGIRSMENRIVSANRSRMYSSNIGEKGYHFWDNLFSILFLKNISFQIIFNELIKLLETATKNSWSNADITKAFHNWVIKDNIQDEDIISPIFMSQRLLNVFDHLFELGYEKGTTSTISKLMKVHQNTIRNVFIELMSDFTTFWRPIFNLERINLYPYLFKLTLNSKSKTNDILASLERIPYLRNIYFGSEKSGAEVIYSPSLICPHIVSDSLREEFEKLLNKNLIDDYTLQLQREKIQYGTITTRPFNPSVSNFQKHLKKNLDEAVFKRYEFSNEKKDFSMEFEAEKMKIDVNLLHFLSVLRTKSLVKARYGVWVDQFNNLCNNNDIPLTNVQDQMDFLNQLEIRARRRGLLDYFLIIRKSYSFADVSGIEIPTDAISDKDFDEIIERVRIFSSLGEFKLYDKTILIIPGITYNHPIADVLMELLEKEGLKPSLFSVRIHKGKFVPFHELFNFETQKWFLGLTK